MPVTEARPSAYTTVPASCRFAVCANPLAASQRELPQNATGKHRRADNRTDGQDFLLARVARHPRAADYGRTGQPALATIESPGAVLLQVGADDSDRGCRGGQHVAGLVPQLPGQKSAGSAAVYHATRSGDPAGSSGAQEADLKLQGRRELAIARSLTAISSNRAPAGQFWRA